MVKVEDNFEDGKKVDGGDDSNMTPLDTSDADVEAQKKASELMGVDEDEDMDADDSGGDIDFSDDDDDEESWETDSKSDQSSDEDKEEDEEGEGASDSDSDDKDDESDEDDESESEDEEDEDDFTFGGFNLTESKEDKKSEEDKQGEGSEDKDKKSESEESEGEDKDKKENASEDKDTGENSSESQSSADKLFENMNKAFIDHYEKHKDFYPPEVKEAWSQYVKLGGGDAGRAIIVQNKHLNKLDDALQAINPSLPFPKRFELAFNIAFGKDVLESKAKQEAKKAQAKTEIRMQRVNKSASSADRGTSKSKSQYSSAQIKMAKRMGIKLP